MYVSVLSEYGYNEALLAMGVSLGKIGFVDSVDCLSKDAGLNSSLTYHVNNNAYREGGRNKFIRMLMLTLSIKAPLYWWREFDSYKVGTVSMSDSTRNVFLARDLTMSDFSRKISKQMLGDLNQARKQGDSLRFQAWLPESFLQSRIVMTNYCALRNMIEQRASINMREWKEFFAAVILGVRHWELLLPQYSSRESAYKCVVERNTGH